MDELRLPAVAARLVAWHNRHPLARRISASQVHAIGYVGVPCVGAGAAPPTLDEVADGAAGSLRERAQARARHSEGVPPELPLDRRTLQADFSEDFIDPLTPRQVARFALRAGRALVRPPSDGPLRQVRADGAHPGSATVPVYLLTAVIETGTHKSRVLLGAGDSAEVLGRRIFSTPRLAAVGATLALLAGVALGVFSPSAPEPVVMAAAAVAPAPAPAPTSAPASAPAVVQAAASATEPVAAPAEPTPPPPDAAPSPDRVDLPDLRPRLSLAAREAAFRSPGAQSPRIEPVVATVPPVETQHAAAAAPAAPPPAPRVASPPAGAPAYAVSTRPLRTRAEADQVRVAMLALLKTVVADEVQVDVLPEGDDWRVVGLPFASRAAADKARGLLVSRGMRVEVLGF